MRMLYDQQLRLQRTHIESKSEIHFLFNRSHGSDAMLYSGYGEYSLFTSYQDFDVTIWKHTASDDLSDGEHILERI